jgi:hypothetical protein|tara:strand:+ start:1348 stop:1764 length:417 start_codon:yes stop_codon:yes gene_type:complete
MIRKYEMEAMANQVMVGLEERIGKLESDIRKTSQYKAIEKKHNQLLALYKKYRAIDKELSNLKEEINDDIRALNDNPNTSKHCRLNNLSWNDSQLVFNCNKWEIKSDIEEKLTVALIKPDAKKYIEKIVAQVVDAIKL